MPKDEKPASISLITIADTTGPGILLQGSSPWQPRVGSSNCNMIMT